MSIPQKIDFYSNFIKHCFDVVLLFVILLVLCPILFEAFIILYLANGKTKALFFKEQPGTNESISRIGKFNTMNYRRDVNGHLFADTVRLTCIERFVRSACIAKLPRHWNMLRGNISFIGSCPLFPQHILIYNKEQARRHKSNMDYHIKSLATLWHQRSRTGNNGSI